MAVEFNAATSTQGDASSFTYSHTVAGADPILLVYVTSRTATSPLVSSVTFNTTENLTKLTQSEFGSTQIGEFWYLENPTATTANVVVTLNATERTATGAVSYYNVSGINTGNWVATSGQDTNPSGTITTENDNATVVIGWGSRDGNTVITVDSAYIERYDERVTGNPAGGQSVSKGLDLGVTSGVSIGTYNSSHTQDNVEAWTLITAELVPVAGVAAQPRNYGFIL